MKKQSEINNLNGVATLFHKVCKLKSSLNRFDFLTLNTI